MDVHNNSEEEVVIPPGETLKVRGNVDTRRAMSKRRKVVEIDGLLE